MEKVRIGNDLKVNFSVYRNGEPESFDGATNISTKIVNESYNKTIAHTYSIVDNVIQFNIDALELKQCGKCRVFISYTKDGDYTVDSPAFELVQYTEDTGGTEIIGVEIVKINISGDIGINRDGASAYEVWEAYPGNEGKTIEQYFEWLHENPTKVDTSRTITAGNGLTGGGDLTEDRTINVVNTNDSIVIGEDGIKVDTQDTLTSDSASKPLSAKQGKALQDNKAEKTRNIVAGAGLTGGGDLSADRTINVVAADDSLIVAADNIKVNTNNTLTSTSTTQPLSANQGKVLNDKVVQVETDLNVINTMYPSFSSVKRIIADSGIIRSKANFNELTGKFVDLLPNTKFLYCPQLAVKLRTTGIYNYITKLYDIGSAMIDGVQTTALSQPYLTGNIAPNEKYGVKNPNGASTFLTHTPISFLATDKWTVSTMLNDFCNNLVTSGCYAGNGSGNSNIYLRHNSANRVRFLSNSVVEYLFNVNNSMIGKNSMVTLVANGLGGLSLYINGKLFQSISSTDTSAVFSQFVNGAAIGTSNFNGVIYYHAVRNIQMSPTQIDEEYQYIRSLYPEMRSVKIGTQEWTVINSELTCTPMGNLIPEVQLNAAWADSTNVYDTTYSATSGTAEQKEYAAVKAAAMWCYYNNDPALGAVYGKLYNWYAVKLLQMDIDYYNAANPTTPWGWRVPTSSDFNTLITYLGDLSVAGGKMKKELFNYWDKPNTGADNSTGFSALGAGRRGNNGIFDSINSRIFLKITDNAQICYFMAQEASSFASLPSDSIIGNSLRLIKS